MILLVGPLAPVFLFIVVLVAVAAAAVVPLLQLMALRILSMSAARNIGI